MKKSLFLTILLVAFASTSASELLSNAKSFAAGGVGGVLSVLVGHPFDLVKVRMQNQRGTENKGTFETLRDIVSEEGVVGIYKGVGAPIVAVAPIWATSFWGFDVGMKLVRAIFNIPAAAPLPLPQLCLAGGFSALPAAVVMVPSERIKCILQMQDKDESKKKYKGMSDCFAQIYKESGIKGLYKGTALTLFRDIPACITYFGIYEIAKQKLMEAKGLASPGMGTALIAGALAGIGFWPVALPMDTLKSRYQTSVDGQYNNMGDVYKEVIEEDGIGGLFKGMGPAMIRAAPANGVSFLGAELTKKALSFIA